MNVEERVGILESEIEKIGARNIRVEGDKAWETSGFRVGMIAAITYAIAVFVLSVIGAEHVFHGALVPTVGFYLSTRSLSFVKRWWVRRFTRRKE